MPLVDDGPTLADCQSVIFILLTFFTGDECLCLK